MNFTREPIIETIISPREGNKLLVRNSKGGTNSEEYYVDAVEVVSFGQAFFFRSMERPKSFLVPVSDYEVVEAKETRVALKNVSHERNIKIGGGREASLRHSHREPPPESAAEPSEEEAQAPSADEANLETAVGTRMDKRRDRRRRRHRRSDDQDWQERRPQERHDQQAPESKGQGGEVADEAKVSSPMFSSLIPPPPTLISETLSRYKDKEFAEGMHLPKKVEEKTKKKEPEEEDFGSDSAPLHRVAPTINAESPEATATFFSPLQSGKDSFFF